jgi:MFS transporter, DHA1 family, multidrug resistance protein
MPGLRRIPTDHVDACHLPDDDERHHPSSELPTGAATPVRRHSSDRPSDERTLADEANKNDLEKGARRRTREQEKGRIPPEERAWEDDIVTFDSKTDPQNPKNVSYL